MSAVVSFIAFLLTGLWFLGVRFPYMEPILGVAWLLMALLIIL